MTWFLSTLQRAKPLLGTMVEIRAEGLEPEALNDAISRAFAAIEQVHQSMSQQLPESELSRLNRAPLMQVIEVSKHFTNVLTEARELASLSAGAFQPCLANAQSRNIQDIDVIGQGLVRRQLDVKVDLDGIAKGYAVDCALEELQARGTKDISLGLEPRLNFILKVDKHHR